jgi:CheY-like chemotaxis protein
MDGKRARILVLDDEPKLAHAIRRTLAPEYDVLVLTSASEALDRIADGEGFDLIVCDLSMPTMDGVAFFERVASFAPKLAERIIIMTGGAFTERTTRFLARTSVLRLEKPFEPAHLRRVVQEQLERLRARPPP